MIRVLRPLAAALLFPAAAFAAEPVKKGMPQLDPSSFASQLFWLAVFFVLFYGFMSLVAVPRLHRILEARQARIADDLNHATTASETAQDLQHELDRAMAQAREQARARIAAANDDIRNQATARDAALAKELTAKIESAEAAIKKAQTEALASIETIAGAIVLQAMPRVAGVTGSDAEARRAMTRVLAARS